MPVCTTSHDGASVAVCGFGFRVMRTVSMMAAWWVAAAARPAWDQTPASPFRLKLKVTSHGLHAEVAYSLQYSDMRSCVHTRDACLIGLLHDFIFHWLGHGL